MLSLIRVARRESNIDENITRIYLMELMTMREDYLCYQVIEITTSAKLFIHICADKYICVSAYNYGTTTNIDVLFSLSSEANIRSSQGFSSRFTCIFTDGSLINHNRKMIK